MLDKWPIEESPTGIYLHICKAFPGLEDHVSIHGWDADAQEIDVVTVPPEELQPLIVALAEAMAVFGLDLAAVIDRLTDLRLAQGVDQALQRRSDERPAR